MVKSIGWMRRGEVYLKVSLIDGTRFWGGKPSKDGQVVFGEFGNERTGGELQDGVEEADELAKTEVARYTNEALEETAKAPPTAQVTGLKGSLSPAFLTDPVRNAG